MIEIIAGTVGPCGEDTVARILDRFYGLGIKPDWRKLEPHKTAEVWTNIDRVIAVAASCSSVSRRLRRSLPAASSVGLGARSRFRRLVAA